ncbi:MAG: aldehyde dehydrogenase family protein, partial [Actinomycetes bacterium]
MPNEHAVVDTVPPELFINGRWRPSSGTKTFDVEDPATGKVLRAVADATPEDGMAALDAAVAAQAGWTQHPPRERGEILRR